jgi:hypothetical protein
VIKRTIIITVATILYGLLLIMTLKELPERPLEEQGTALTQYTE